MVAANGFAWLAVCSGLLIGCGGNDRRTDGNTDVLYPDAASWDEPRILGFADAAFAVLAGAGELGAQSARRLAVRQLAAEMQRQHAALAARSDSLAGERGVTPQRPLGLEFATEHQGATAALRNERRSHFDDSYLEHVANTLERILDRIYDVLSVTNDAAVSAMLAEAQERIEEHASEASRLRLLRTRLRPMWHREA